MGRAESITRFIRAYDRELFCERYTEGKLCIYRKSKRIEAYEIDGLAINFVRPAKHFIFALTDNGKMDGRPVDWGYFPILNRIKASDLWTHDIASQMLAEEDARERSNARARSNTIESFLLDYRRKFAKTFNDYNTTSMEKKDSRRIGDLKHGNR